MISPHAWNALWVVSNTQQVEATCLELLQHLIMTHLNIKYNGILILETLIDLKEDSYYTQK